MTRLSAISHVTLSICHRELSWDLINDHCSFLFPSVVKITKKSNHTGIYLYTIPRWSWPLCDSMYSWLKSALQSQKREKEPPEWAFEKPSSALTLDGVTGCERGGVRQRCKAIDVRTRLTPHFTEKKKCLKGQHPAAFIDSFSKSISEPSEGRFNVRSRKRCISHLWSGFLYQFQ